MRCVLVVGDGMADESLQELNFRSPLEAVKPRFMNYLSSRGALGLLDPIATGVVPGSDSANLSFLGYNPWDVCRGRGPFEAVGVGLELRPEDLGFRCNFVTVDEGLCLVDERAGRVGDVESKVFGSVMEQLRFRVNSDVEAFFKGGLGFKGALVLRGDDLSCRVSSVLPKIGSPARVVPLDDSVAARHTADVLNEFIELSNEMLKNHPLNVERVRGGLCSVNAVLPWGGGMRPDLACFGDKYGLRASCVAAASLIKGIGRLSGMTVPDVAGATGDVDTDVFAKAEAVLSALREGYDFVFVHVEASDEVSHDGNVTGKMAVIEKIDNLIGKILEGTNLSDTLFVLVSDHVTSCRTRAHTGDGVPVCFSGVNVVPDDVLVFSERSAYKGGLGRINGKDIMPMVLSYLGKQKFGV